MGRLKSCMRCGKVHEVGYLCSGKRTYRKKQTSEIDKFRSTSKWQKKRRDIKDRDHCMCQICKLEGINETEVEVHHIVPMKEDESLWLDDENLISLCKKHHELAEAGKIEREMLVEIVKSMY